MIVFACLTPHPPILLPDIGSESDRLKLKKTIQSLEALSLRLKEAKPDIIIITSPHEDWGIKVPLHFLMPNDQFSTRLPARQVSNFNLQFDNLQFAIYPLLTTLDSPKQHFEWGKEIALKLPPDLRIAWIASGDMSHRLKKDGPYGLHPSGEKFDNIFIELLKNKDVEGILNLDHNLVEEAGECGLRSFCLLLGALVKLRLAWQPEILSYEGPYGVGYLVSQLK